MLKATDYPRLALVGIVSLIRSINVAIPFLLDLVYVPADTFQLFLATSLVNSRFGTLTFTLYRATLALAGSFALTGKIKLSGPRILWYILLTVRATAVTMFALFA